MKKVITLNRTQYKQKAYVEYDELSTNNELIKKKKLIITSLSALQLLVTTLTVEQSDELAQMITTLENTYIEIEKILKLSDDKDDFYDDYIN